MEALVDDGLVKHIGVSNFSVKQVEGLLETARIKPVINQVELHPLLAQRKLVGVCARKVRLLLLPLEHSTWGSTFCPLLSTVYTTAALPAGVVEAVSGEILNLLCNVEHYSRQLIHGVALAGCTLTARRACSCSIAQGVKAAGLVKLQQR